MTVKRLMIDRGELKCGRCTLRATALAGVFLCATAHGEVTAFANHPAFSNNEEAWNQVAGEVTRIGSEDIKLGAFNGNLWADKGVLSNSFDGGILTKNEYPFGYNLATTWGVDPHTRAIKLGHGSEYISFTDPINALSFHWATLGGVVGFRLSNDGLFVGLAEFPVNNDVSYPRDFIGVYSDIAFDRVELFMTSWYPPIWHTSYSSGFAFSAIVPAPGAGALLALSAFVVRRRRR